MYKSIIGDLDKNIQIRIEPYTKERIDDVLAFEHELRRQEDFWGWEIDKAYEESVRKSFADPLYKASISFIAYVENNVVGRIDASLIPSHFDGSIKAYLDWICVLKSYRHNGVAQALMKHLRKVLKEQYNVSVLIGLIASNKNAQSFYRNLPTSLIKDEGIWIDL